jgi:hypothetical protein
MKNYAYVFNEKYGKFWIHELSSISKIVRKLWENIREDTSTLWSNLVD